MDKGHLSGDLLCDLAEGQLAPAAQREAEAHVEGCADCRRELEALQGYFQDMSSLETLKAPDRFLTKVHGRIAKASPWKRILAALSSPRLMPVPMAAFCLMMVGAFLFYHSRKAQMDSEHAVVRSSPAQASESPLEEERVATIPTTRYSMPQPKQQIVTSGEARKPVTLPSRAVRTPAAESGADPSKDLAKSGETRLSGRRGLQVVTREEPAGSGTGGAHVGAGSMPAEGEQLALATPVEKKASVKASKGKVDRLKYERDSEAMPTDEGRRPSPSSQDVAFLDEQDSETESLPIARSNAPAAATKSAPASPPAPSPSVASSQKVASPRVAAEPAPPSVTPKPWAPMAYTLKWNIGRADAAGFRPGLASLGIKVLRHEAGSADRYELEFPAVKVASLETYLRGYGDLVPAPKAISGKKDGAPIRMTLRITRAP